MNRSEVVTFQERLFDEQRRLLEEIERSRQAQIENLQAPGEITDLHTHNADQDVEGVESERTLEDRLRKELAQVQRALRHIQDSTYGICEQCNGEISKERLEALPQATLCVACASQP